MLFKRLFPHDLEMPVLFCFMKELISDDTIFLSTTHLVDTKARPKQAHLDPEHTPALSSSQSTKAASVHYRATPRGGAFMCLLLCPSREQALMRTASLTYWLREQTEKFSRCEKPTICVRKYTFVHMLYTCYKLHIFQITGKIFQFMYFKELSKTLTCEIALTQD